MGFHRYSRYVRLAVGTAVIDAERTYVHQYQQLMCLRTGPWPPYECNWQRRASATGGGRGRTSSIEKYLLLQYYVPGTSYKIDFFTEYKTFLPVAGLFSCSRLRGTQGARLYTTAQEWVPAGLRGACSGRSKSRNLASNPGIVFRRAIAIQAHGKNTVFSRREDAPVTLSLMYLYLQQLYDSGTAHTPDCLAVLLARGAAHTAYPRLSGCARSSLFCCGMSMLRWKPLKDTLAISTAGCNLCGEIFCTIIYSNVVQDAAVTLTLLYLIHPTMNTFYPRLRVQNVRTVIALANLVLFMALTSI